MNDYKVMQNADGQYTVNFLVDGNVVSLVCGDEATAKIMAAHLDAMVQRVTVDKVAF